MPSSLGEFAAELTLLSMENVGENYESQESSAAANASKAAFASPCPLREGLY